MHALRREREYTQEITHRVLALLKQPSRPLRDLARAGLRTGGRVRKSDRRERVREAHPSLPVVLYITRENGQRVGVVMAWEDFRNILEDLMAPNNPTPGDLLWQALQDADHLADDDIDSLAVRRELAAASVVALGDFWDNEVDLEWQDFAPVVG